MLGRSLAMERRLAELETRLKDLAAEIKDVQDRLALLERRLATGPESLSPWPPTGKGAPNVGVDLSTPRLPPGVVPLLGRTLLVLAGAYLLRAVTEAGFVLPGSGVALGLAYAALWLVFADTEARAGRRVSAVFHGFSTALVAYPLVWETTSRFGLISPRLSAAILLAYPALGLVVASRHELGAIAWVHGLSALITTLGLLLTTGSLLAFTIALVVMAGAVEGLAFRDRWLGLRWPVAFCLDLAILELVLMAGRPGGPPEGYSAPPPMGVALVGLVLVVLYLGSTAARTLRNGRPVAPFEVVQVLLALPLGLGGAARMIALAGGRTALLGAFCCLLGAACYAAAFAFLEHRTGQGRNFYAYTTLGGGLTLGGSAAAFSDATLTVVWSLLGLVALGLGRRFARATLKLHGALYLTASAMVGGLMAAAYDGLLADPGLTWSSVTPTVLASAFAALVGYAVLAGAGAGHPPAGSHLVAQALVALLAMWSSAGLGASVFVRALAAAAPGTDPALVAVVRTGVLAVWAVGLAWAARRWSLRELIWLAYALLAATAVKLPMEDLKQGRPLTLFVAFALYGGALIAAPRLARRG